MSEFYERAGQRYVARKRLRVGEGHIEPGEEFPASEVTPSLLTAGWVEALPAGTASAAPAAAEPDEEDELPDETAEGDAPARKRSRRRKDAE